jgi:hypothetical protein
MRSSATFGRSVVLTTTIALACAAPMRAAVTDRETRTLPLPADRTIALSVTVGEVRILGETRSDVVIEVVRHAPDTDSLSRLPLRIDEEPERIEIHALQTESGTDPRLRADVTLRVPAQAQIEAIHVLEGRLELTGVGGRVNASLQRGPIEATRVAGTMRLETGIGHVVVRGARLEARGLLRLRTFNGDVRLALAERPTDARILALALNGTIASDIPLTMKDTWGPRWGETTLGRGEPVISIDVVTGRIEITSK